MNNLSHVTALNYLYAVAPVCILGGLVSAGMLGWDHISTGPIIAQGNKDGTVHGANAPRMADQDSKLWHSRASERHNSVLAAKLKTARKTRGLPELGVEISQRWSEVLINAGLSALRSSDERGRAGHKCMVAKICIRMQDFIISLEASMHRIIPFLALS